MLATAVAAANGKQKVARETAAAATVDGKRKAARETIDILDEISTILNTHLDRQSLSYCVSLIENGVNPESLAKVVKELRAQNARYQVDGPQN